MSHKVPAKYRYGRQEAEESIAAHFSAIRARVQGHHAKMMECASQTTDSSDGANSQNGPETPNDAGGVTPL